MMQSALFKVGTRGALVCLYREVEAGTEVMQMPAAEAERMVRMLTTAIRVARDYGEQGDEPEMVPL